MVLGLAGVFIMAVRSPFRFKTLLECKAPSCSIQLVDHHLRIEENMSAYSLNAFGLSRERSRTPPRLAACGSRGMQISVRTWLAQRFTVDCAASDTIADLKLQINAWRDSRRPIPLDLSFQGEQLQDGRTIGSYQIPVGAMLSVKPRCTVFTPTIPIYVRPVGGEDEDEDMVVHVSSTDTMQEVRAFAVRRGVAIQHLSTLFFDHREQHLSVSLGDHACEQ